MKVAHFYSAVLLKKVPQYYIGFNCFFETRAGIDRMWGSNKKKKYGSALYSWSAVDLISLSQMLPNGDITSSNLSVFSFLVEAFLEKKCFFKTIKNAFIF